MAGAPRSKRCLTSGTAGNSQADSPGWPVSQKYGERVRRQSRGQAPRIGNLDSKYPRAFRRQYRSKSVRNPPPGGEGTKEAVKPFSARLSIGGPNGPITGKTSETAKVPREGIQWVRAGPKTGRRKWRRPSTVPTSIPCDDPNPPRKPPCVDPSTASVPRVFSLADHHLPWIPQRTVDGHSVGGAGFTVACRKE